MDIKEYKKKIANLSVNEQKLRDLYLRDMALGKVQGPPTGYASIDKPWLKYYSEEDIMADIVTGIQKTDGKYAYNLRNSRWI